MCCFVFVFYLTILRESGRETDYQSMSPCVVSMSLLKYISKLKWKNRLNFINNSSLHFILHIMCVILDHGKFTYYDIQRFDRSVYEIKIENLYLLSYYLQRAWIFFFNLQVFFPLEFFEIEKTIPVYRDSTFPLFSGFPLFASAWTWNLR